MEWSINNLPHTYSELRTGGGGEEKILPMFKISVRGQTNQFAYRKNLKFGKVINLAQYIHEIDTMVHNHVKYDRRTMRYK